MKKILVTIFALALLAFPATSSASSFSGTYTGNAAVNRAIPHGVGSVPVSCFVVPATVAVKYIKVSQNLTTWYSLSSTATIVSTATDATNFYATGLMNTNAVVYLWTCHDTASTGADGAPGTFPDSIATDFSLFVYFVVVITAIVLWLYVFRFILAFIKRML